MTRNRRRYDSTTRQDRRRQADLFARFRLHKLSLCQYLSWYFSPSTQHDGVHKHRPKLFNTNWTQLKHVLDLIIQLARKDGPGARGRISDWIANQSDSIIVKEMKRTKSAFVSSHDMSPEVLASDQIDARLDAIVEGNSCISGRIRNLLSHCGDPQPFEELNCDKLISDSTDVHMEDAREDSSGSDAERECFKEQRVSFVPAALSRPSLILPIFLTCFAPQVKNEYDKNPLTAMRKWLTGTERTIWREHLVFWTLLVGFHDDQFLPAKSNMSSPYHAKTFLEGFEIFLEKEVIEELANAQLDCRGAFDWCNYLWTGKFSVYKDRIHNFDEQLQSSNPLEPDVTGMAWFRSSRSAGEVDNIQILLYTRMRPDHEIDLKHAIDRRVAKIRFLRREHSWSRHGSPSAEAWGRPLLDAILGPLNRVLRCLLLTRCVQKQAAMSLPRPTGSVSRSSR